MLNKKTLFVLALLVIVAFTLSACAGEAGPPGPTGPEGPQGEQGEQGPALTAADLTCTECHNDTTLITAKKTAWEESLHGMGTATAYAGGRDGCAACHSGGAFSEMVAQGVTPAEFVGGDPEPTHQECRTCHEIHTTYTGADWALATTDPVVLIASGVTFDGGQGNLCANCHQPRTEFAATDGIVNVSSTHWGPHHGPQAAMLLGVGGAGVEGEPAGHATLVEDTCVSCHLASHAFEPSLAACTECHAELENFDVNGLQTEVAALAADLEKALIAKGMWDEAGEPVVGEYPEAEAAALWNYIYIVVEDKSMGLHNPAYTKAMLEASIEALK